MNHDNTLNRALNSYDLILAIFLWFETWSVQSVTILTFILLTVFFSKTMVYNRGSKHKQR